LWTKKKANPTAMLRAVPVSAREKAARRHPTSDVESFRNDFQAEPTSTGGTRKKTSAISRKSGPTFKPLWHRLYIGEALVTWDKLPCSQKLVSRKSPHPSTVGNSLERSLWGEFEGVEDALDSFGFTVLLASGNDHDYIEAVTDHEKA
jgi:hypothetical protein